MYDHFKRIDLTSSLFKKMKEKEVTQTHLISKKDKSDKKKFNSLNTDRTKTTNIHSIKLEIYLKCINFTHNQ